MVKPIPDGYPSVSPYLVVDKPAELLDFLAEAFGAEERMRMEAPGGSIAHAETEIGDSLVMVGGSNEQAEATRAVLNLYIEDCDETYRQALAAGATPIREPEDQFYGDRMAGVRDPAGNSWWIATHVEDVPEDEMRRRAEQAAQSS